MRSRAREGRPLSRANRLSLPGLAAALGLVLCALACGRGRAEEATRAVVGTWTRDQLDLRFERTFGEGGAYSFVVAPLGGGPRRAGAGRYRVREVEGRLVLQTCAAGDGTDCVTSGVWETEHLQLAGDGMLLSDRPDGPVGSWRRR